MANLRFRFTVSGSPVTFDAEGTWEWRQVLLHKPASGSATLPPETTQIREVWTIRLARIISSDGTTATGWSEFLALRAHWEARGTATTTTQPTNIEIYNLDSSSVELTLGPSSFEDFRLEEVASASDPNNVQGMWGVTFPFEFSISAIRKNADADGIVRYEQTLTQSVKNGLKTITWNTLVSTKQGTSALVKAKAFASLQAQATSVLGSSYTFLTGNDESDNGIDYEILDSDQRSSDTSSSYQTTARTPTMVRATSTVRQWAITAGMTGTGSSPEDIALVVITDDDGKRTKKTTMAKAEGPGAKAWCETHQPAEFDQKIIRDGQHNNSYQITWTTLDDTASGSGDRQNSSQRQWDLKVVMTEGVRSFEMEPVVGGYNPVLFGGPRQPWKCMVTVTVTKRATSPPTRDEMKFPPLLADWRLSHAESTESDVQEGQDAEGNIYKREASLTYYSRKKPTEYPLDYILNNPSSAVESYWL